MYGILRVFKIKKVYAKSSTRNYKITLNVYGVKSWIKVINVCFIDTINKIFEERSIFHNYLIDTCIHYVNLDASVAS